MKFIFCLHINIKGFFKFLVSFYVCVARMKLIFCMQINMIACYKLILSLSWGWSTILKVLRIVSLQHLNNIWKKAKDEVDFLYADKHESFLQVDFNTLGIKVSYKVILSLLMGMNKHSQTTQSSKFATSLQYLKK